MPVADVPVVHTITERLRQLLTRARTIKQSIAIEPPLASAELERDVLAIAQPSSKTNDFSAPSPSTPPELGAFDAAARHIFYELLAAHDILSPEFVSIWNLLDIIQLCADAGQCDHSLALWLLEELLDAQTIEGCRVVFDYLESRRERLITHVYTKNKQMIVLRSCNELLRRLSRAEDAVFCGRVFIFLFQSFPLGDKSSVNLRGEFHVENKTTFDEAKRSDQGADDAMEVDQPTKDGESEPNGDGAERKDHEAVKQTTNETSRQPSEPPKVVTTDTSTTKPTDIKDEAPLPTSEELYPVFWRLQHVFSNPPSAFEDDVLESFKTGLEATIRKFKSVPKVPNTKPPPPPTSATINNPLKRKRSNSSLSNLANPPAPQSLASTFTPKYLTSIDLFTLELSDLTFQRHILVQSLILLDFLLSLTPKARARTAAHVKTQQKAVAYTYTLSPANEAWATRTRAQIALYLREGPDGNYYYRMVDNVLARDKHWARWKAESCPPITRPPIPTATYLEAVEGANIRSAPRRPVKRLPPGAVPLDFLSADPKRALKSAQALRDARPAPETLLVEAQGIELDIEFDVPRQEQLEAREKELEEKTKGARPTPAQREEMETLHKEKRAALREKAALEGQRATRTWRLLRGATRTRLEVLGVVDEAGDLSAVVKKKETREENSATEHADGAAAQLNDAVDTRAEPEAGADGVEATTGETDEDGERGDGDADTVDEPAAAATNGETAAVEGDGSAYEQPGGEA